VGQRRQRTKQSEYEMYLKDDRVPSNVNIDVLKWWMTNGRKYPTIVWHVMYWLFLHLLWFLN
jgi:hypothetical protein